MIVAADTNRGPRVNVADRLTDLARQRPDDIAVASTSPGGYDTITFAQLDHDATLYARGLVARGVGPGVRMALLVKPGIDFVALVFALLRTGATMVLVDSGLGLKNIVRCLESTSPDGFVGIPQAQLLRGALFWKFREAKINVTVGARWGMGGQKLELLKELGEHEALETREAPPEGEGGYGVASLPHTGADDPAAIVFTSGSTGPPKGVLYRHETFVTQADEIQRQYGLSPGGVDLACFPLFGLFNVACGVTTVLPEMDFSRPASCDPRKLFKAANDWRVTQAFASPAVWDRLSHAAEASGDKIPTLRKAFSCGAPVPSKVIRRTLKMVHPEAELHTPYGATESLPVATIEAQEILNETAEKTDQGAGVCVGRKFDSIEWRVIRITDEPIATIDDTEELPQREIGELIVRGPQVSREYLTQPETSAPGSKDHNALAKITDGQSIWHRMGDVGYLDEQGCFWYCGRKSHRVATAEGTLYTECVEGVFNTVPMVQRSALVGGKNGKSQKPVLVFEPANFQTLVGREGHPSEKELDAALLQSLQDIAAEYDHTKAIATYLSYPKLPTDIRHNSKINREKLAVWAAKQLRSQ